MKQPLAERKLGSGERDEQGRSMAAIVMQNVQTEQFQTERTDNTIKPTRINRKSAGDKRTSEAAKTKKKE